MSIFFQTTFCINYKLASNKHAFNTLVKVLLSQLFSLLLNQIFYLLYNANLETALTNLNFDEVPEVLNGVEIGQLCRPNHIKSTFFSTKFGIIFQGMIYRAIIHTYYVTIFSQKVKPRGSSKLRD